MSDTKTEARGPGPRDGTMIGRLAYPELFTAKRFQEQRNVPGSGSGDPKFSCSVIAYGKFVEPMRASIQNAMKAAINAVYPDAKALPPRGLRGTAKKDPIIKPVVDYPKMWAEAPDDAIFARASGLDMPGFLNADMEVMGLETAKILLLPGCWVRVSFTAFHYTQGGDPGVSLALNYVQFLRPGPRLGVGRGAAADLLPPLGDVDSLFEDMDV